MQEDTTITRNYEEDEIDLIRVIKVVFHRKLLLSIITGVSLVVGTLGMTILGKGGETYVSEFNYSVPSLVEDKLIDGSSFNYKNILSKNNLKCVIDSNEDYKSLDIDELISSDNTSISYVSIQDTNKTYTEHFYKISFPKSFFNSKEQAESFIKDVCYYPIAYNLNYLSSRNLSADLELIDITERYEDEITLLNKQFETIKKLYNDLISSYGNVNVDGNSLSTHLTKYTALPLKINIDSLSREIKQNGYIKDTNKEINSLLTEKEEKEKIIYYNNVKIDELKDTVSDLINNSSTVQSVELEAYNSKISSLLVSNVDLQKDIDDINLKLEKQNSAPDSFNNQVSIVKNQLLNETSKYQQIEEEVTKAYSRIDFYETKIVRVENKVSLIKNAAISLVAGFVLGLFINFVLDFKYLKEEFPGEVVNKN